MLFPNQMILILSLSVRCQHSNSQLPFPNFYFTHHYLHFFNFFIYVFVDIVTHFSICIKFAFLKAINDCFLCDFMPGSEAPHYSCEQINFGRKISSVFFCQKNLFFDCLVKLQDSFSKQLSLVFGFEAFDYSYLFHSFLSNQIFALNSIRCFYANV